MACAIFQMTSFWYRPALFLVNLFNNFERQLSRFKANA